MKNLQLQDAVIRRIEIIGEASKNIPRAVKQANNDIPWAQISNYRDFITHSYFGASMQRIWVIAKKESPQLKESFQRIKLL
jgi:uncharacterized protein with HEPN domain